jgi:hypothetical protein
MTKRAADVPRRGNPGYTQQQLGRMAGERAALNNGTLDTHTFEPGRNATVCMFCGEVREMPVHEPPLPPALSGRVARPRRKHGHGHGPQPNPARG